MVDQSTCDHKFKVLESKVSKLYADGSLYVTNVDALFYCEKCMEIEQVVREITNDQ